MTRSVRMLMATSSVVLTIGFASPAWAADCPFSDPTCLTGGLDATASGSVTDVVTDVVVNAVDDPGGTVDPVVNDVVNEVKRLAGQTGEPPPPGGGGGGQTGNGGGGPGKGTGDGGAGLSEPRLQRGTGLPSSTVLLATSAPDRNAPIDRGPTLRDRVTAAVAAAARSIAVVLVLLGVAIGFVLVQDRLDRKDPKLALAPVGSDVVLFA